LGNTRTNFIPAVESMRGLAALAVSGLHSYLYWTHFRALRTPDNPLPDAYHGGILHDVLLAFFVGAGASAVTLFFVISGFVLLIALEKNPSPHGFLVSRVFRIYPAHIAIVVAWFLVEPWLLFGDLRHSVWDVLQTATLGFSQNYVPMNWPIWSLRVEIAAIPIILLAWFVRTQFGVRGLILLALILAAFSFARNLYAGDMIGRYAFVFAFGILAHDLARSLPSLPRFLGASLISIAIAVDLAARPMLGYHAQAAILVEAICCMVALALIVRGSSSVIFSTLLHCSVVRGLGRISYGYFLIHFPVLWVLLRQVPDCLLLSTVPAGLLVWVMDIMITVPLAVGCYLWIEKPGVALGRKVVVSDLLPWRRRTCALDAL
jgi:peptidoglycan/LPS O-acetylase OafA/YrhL